MTHEEFQQNLENMPAEELIKECKEFISNACKTGGKNFVMHIPPRLTDFDIIFSELVTRYKSLLPCTGNCGMNYCDENGCIDRKRNTASLIDPPVNVSQS
jgi:hypothetical protein